MRQSNRKCKKVIIIINLGLTSSKLNINLKNKIYLFKSLDFNNILTQNVIIRIFYTKAFVSFLKNFLINVFVNSTIIKFDDKYNDKMPFLLEYLNVGEI